MTRAAPSSAAAAALLAALLTACTTVGPDYQRPAIALPAQFPATSPADSGSVELTSDWWRLFGDAELTRLFEQALDANADIAQAAARVEQAEGQLREVGSAMLPTVNLGASAGRSEIGCGVPGNSSGRTQRGNDFRVGLSTSFEFDFWGRLRRTTEAARAQLLAGAAARDTVRLTVAGAVAQSWFALRPLDEQIAATRQTLASREAGTRLFEQRLQADVGSRLDLEQAEILRADSAVQLRELQRQRATRWPTCARRATPPST